jgi:hypothetical protein
LVERGARATVRIRDGCSGEGFSSERDAAEALERALEHLRRQKGIGSTLTLKELLEEYLAQYDAEPETIDKLRWLLAKALRPFGGHRLPELGSQEIAAWRMTIAAGHRFEVTQALRQLLARAVAWGMIDVNPAKQRVPPRAIDPYANRSARSPTCGLCSRRRQSDLAARSHARPMSSAPRCGQTRKTTMRERTNP